MVVFGMHIKAARSQITPRVVDLFGKRNFFETSNEIYAIKNSYERMVGTYVSYGNVKLEIAGF
jgi:hypothetical protein